MAKHQKQSHSNFSSSLGFLNDQREALGSRTDDTVGVPSCSLLKTAQDLTSESKKTQLLYTSKLHLKSSTAVNTISLMQS